MVETLINLLLEQHCYASAQFEHDRSISVNRAINTMRHAIEEEQRRKINLGCLAKAAGVNEKHLCRLFRKAFGYSPMETYRLLRLQLALALVSQSNLTIKQIAHRCKFDDPAYFSRCFSAVFRFSPRQVRHRLTEGLLTPASPLPPDLTPRVAW